MALQHTRGHSFREGQRKLANYYVKLQYERVTDEGIRYLLRERGMAVTDDTVAAFRQDIDDLQRGDLWVQPQDAAVIGQAVRATDLVSEYLLYREWLVYRTPPILVTCDEPITIIGGPGLPRTERAGMANAGVIVFPLTPGALLVMPRPDLVGVRGGELDHVETAELNREIVAQAARWAFERPSRQVTKRMEVPPAPEPTILERGVGRTKRGENFRIYKPTRWVNTDIPPPWPVAKWWVGTQV
jgi:hypothetical protein